MKQSMIILTGLPGSGKSKYAKDLIEKCPNFKRINWGELRKLTPGYIGFVGSLMERIIYE